MRCSLACSYNMWAVNWFLLVARSSLARQWCTTTNNLHGRRTFRFLLRQWLQMTIQRRCLGLPWTSSCWNTHRKILWWSLRNFVTWWGTTFSILVTLTTHMLPCHGVCSGIIANHQREFWVCVTFHSALVPITKGNFGHVWLQGDAIVEPSRSSAKFGGGSTAEEVQLRVTHTFSNCLHQSEHQRSRAMWALRLISMVGTFLMLWRCQNKICLSMAWIRIRVTWCFFFLVSHAITMYPVARVTVSKVLYFGITIWHTLKGTNCWQIWCKRILRTTIISRQVQTNCTAVLHVSNR